MTREEIITGLREAADFIEAHPDLEIATYGWCDLMVAGGSAEALAATARQLGRADKHMGENIAEVSRAFGPVKLGAYTRRENVCEARVVGTREVERPIMVEHGTEIVVEDVIEWDCSPLLGGDGPIPDWPPDRRGDLAT